MLYKNDTYKTIVGNVLILYNVGSILVTTFINYQSNSMRIKIYLARGSQNMYLLYVDLFLHVVFIFHFFVRPLENKKEFKVKMGRIKFLNTNPVWADILRDADHF